jgi:hypothetical protein
MDFMNMAEKKFGVGSWKRFFVNQEALVVDLRDGNTMIYTLEFVREVAAGRMEI